MGGGSCGEGTTVVCGQDHGSFTAGRGKKEGVVGAAEMGFDWDWGGNFGGRMVAVGESAHGWRRGVICGVGCDGRGRSGDSLVGWLMSRFALRALLALALVGGAVQAQEADGGEKAKKPRPPRVPDAPFVPKRDMVQREKGQFWAGPPGQDRFVQIMALALVPREQLGEKLEAWPTYKKLSEEQRIRLGERIDEFWAKSTKEALAVAKDFDLQVGPENEQAFVRAYWMEKMATEKAIRKQLSPLRKRLEQEAKERLENTYKSGGKR